jgi:hypothetical protein
MLDVNTTSRYSTHFLRGVELIKKAREDFSVPSENWPQPTEYRFGSPNDNYYAEVWLDGMDWQLSYWIIEEITYMSPQIQPLIIFNNHEERDRFNSCDFDDLLKAIMYFRRDLEWAYKKEVGIFSDTIWPFLSLFKDELRYKKMKLYSFKHASQQRVVFWLNESFIPSREKGYLSHEDHWDNRKSPKELVRSTQKS